MVLAEIIGWDIVIVLAIIALLFGGAKLPKLARSLGSAKGEFEAGLKEGDTQSKKATEVTAKAAAVEAAPELSPVAKIAEAEARAAEAEAAAARAKAEAARLAAEVHKSEA
jgi:sec-independent protein translocase protein TatA